MGLDMYLNKKTYVQNWSHHKKSDNHNVTVKRGGKLREDIKPDRVTYVTEQVSYWRKFNALHGWFVNELNDGFDNCAPIHVSKENFIELLELLKGVQNVINNSKKKTKILKDWNGEEYEHNVYLCEEEVKEVLPPTQGFFFGGYEVDDYYKQEVDRTIMVIEETLKEIEEAEKLGIYSSDYYYEASW